MPLSSKQKDFVNRVYQAGLNIGLNDSAARLAASQAGLESGYGRSVKGNNFFGIKAGRSWKGETQRFLTWEDVGGKKVRMYDTFRKYGSFEESLQDWKSLIARRWPGALTAKTFDGAVKALRTGKQGGYATDKKYVGKVNFVNRHLTEPKARFTDVVNHARQFEIAPPNLGVGPVSPLDAHKTLKHASTDFGIIPSLPRSKPSRLPDPLANTQAMRKERLGLAGGMLPRPAPGPGVGPSLAPAPSDPIKSLIERESDPIRDLINKPMSMMPRSRSSLPSEAPWMPSQGHTVMDAVMANQPRNPAMGGSNQAYGTSSYNPAPRQSGGIKSIDDFVGSRTQVKPGFGTGFEDAGTPAPSLRGAPSGSVTRGGLPDLPSQGMGGVNRAVQATKNPAMGGVNFAAQNAKSPAMGGVNIDPVQAKNPAMGGMGPRPQLSALPEKIEAMPRPAYRPKTVKTVPISLPSQAPAAPVDLVGDQQPLTQLPQMAPQAPQAPQVQAPAPVDPITGMPRAKPGAPGSILPLGAKPGPVHPMAPKLAKGAFGLGTTAIGGILGGPLGALAGRAVGRGMSGRVDRAARNFFSGGVPGASGHTYARGSAMHRGLDAWNRSGNSGDFFDRASPGGAGDMFRDLSANQAYHRERMASKNGRSGRSRDWTDSFL